jgi:hypothetical protein
MAVILMSGHKELWLSIMELSYFTSSKHIILIAHQYKDQIPCLQNIIYCSSVHSFTAAVFGNLINLLCCILKDP